MRSGTTGGCGSTEPPPSRSSPYQAACRHPSQPLPPLLTFQKLPFQTDFFTSGFSANEDIFTLKVEETTSISLGMTFRF